MEARKLFPFQTGVKMEQVIEVTERYGGYPQFYQNGAMLHMKNNQKIWLPRYMDPTDPYHYGKFKTK